MGLSRHKPKFLAVTLEGPVTLMHCDSVPRGVMVHWSLRSSLRWHVALYCKEFGVTAPRVHVVQWHMWLLCHTDVMHMKAKTINIIPKPHPFFIHVLQHLFYMFFTALQV